MGSPRDGTYGRKLFYNARGYSVTECYNRMTDNQVAAGFSFASYKAQIDAGRPILLNLAGHTIVGIGYADPSTVFLNDTWDHQTHSMIWGGSYDGMQLQSVSVVTLAPVGSTVPAITSLDPSSARSGGPAFTLTVNGTNFVSGSVVRWNGSDRVTTYVSSTRLTAAIPASDIGAAAAASVTVFNPSPGGGLSNSVSFPIGKLRYIYLPSIGKAQPGPQPGFWASSSGSTEFYVTSDRLYVDRFAIYVDPRQAGCEVYKITHLVKEPISGSAFSFTGAFYASGTFVSPTAANVTLGLRDLLIEGCGYLTGGPWSVALNWKSTASQGRETFGGAGPDSVTPIVLPPGVDVLRID